MYSIKSLLMHGNIRSYSPTAWDSSPKRGKPHRTDGRDFRISSCAGDSPPISWINRVGGNAGRGTESVTITPQAFDEEIWFNRFRVGIWPDYFEGVQFSRDREALNQYFRQMTPMSVRSISRSIPTPMPHCSTKIGPAIFVTHSQGGPVGWQTLLKTDNIRAIVSYEPGGGIPFPEGQVPEEGKILTLSKKRRVSKSRCPIL